MTTWSSLSAWSARSRRSHWKRAFTQAKSSKAALTILKQEKIYTLYLVIEIEIKVKIYPNEKPTFLQKGSAPKGLVSFQSFILFKISCMLA